MPSSGGGPPASLPPMPSGGGPGRLPRYSSRVNWPSPFLSSDFNAARRVGDFAGVNHAVAVGVERLDDQRQRRTRRVGGRIRRQRRQIFIRRQKPSPFLSSVSSSALALAISLESMMPS